MTFTRAPYEIAAPALLAELDQIADRFAREHDDALEALSILSTLRDAEHEIGRPLVYRGEHAFVASTGIALATFPTLEKARAFVAAQADERTFPRGRAIVEVEYAGAEPLFTRHELEAPRLELDEVARARAVRDFEDTRYGDGEVPYDAAARRFENEYQEERARNLAASAPLGRTSLDDELDALGWTRRYDGDPYSTELTPAAQAAMFDHLGRLTDRYRPRSS